MDKIEKILTLICMVVVIGVNWLYIYKFERRVEDWDDSDTTPNDYAVMITGLPKTENRKEIENYMKDLLNSLGYDCSFPSSPVEVA